MKLLQAGQWVICLAAPVAFNSKSAMNFAPFWARGQSGDFVSWRWSFHSLEEAQALANEAARQIGERIRNRDFPARHQGYYPGRPFREQILREIKNDAGEVLALITRNSYGCQVLNTSRVMFVDVDLPEAKSSGGFLKRLFGRAEPPPPDNRQNEALARIESWTRNNDGWGWRIYRTRAGLRLLATHALFDPETVTASGVFGALGADPLYTQLCRSQKCFRARLTPKPWRCGVYDKPDRWPWLNPKAEQRFQKWQTEYQTESSNWATTELFRKIGAGDIHADVQAIIKIHDESTRAESKMNLA